MWPDLRKATFHAHNIKTHFSPLNDSCTRWLTIQAGIDAQSYTGCFCCGLFLGPVRRPRVFGWPSNGYISLDKQTAGCNSPHDWPGVFGHGFSCFVWYVEVKITPMDAIWLVLVKTDPLPATSWLSTHPPSSHPVGVLLLLATPVKKLSKMAGNLSSYSLNGWWIDRL